MGWSNIDTAETPPHAVWLPIDLTEEEAWKLLELTHQSDKNISEYICSFIKKIKDETNKICPISDTMQQLIFVLPPDEQIELQGNMLWFFLRKALKENFIAK